MGKYTTDIHDLLEAGIRKCKIADIKFEGPKKDGSGEPKWVVIYFDIEGTEFRHVIFPVNEEQTAKSAESRDVDPETAIAKEYIAKNRVFKHFLHLFYDKESAKISPPSNVKDPWEWFAKKFIEKMKKADLDTELEILLVYNTKGFLTLPRYPIFIQKAGENRIRINTRYHKITKDTVESESFFNTKESDDDIQF